MCAQRGALKPDARPWRRHMVGWRSCRAEPGLRVGAGEALPHGRGELGPLSVAIYYRLREGRRTFCKTKFQKARRRKEGTDHLRIKLQ